MLKYIRKFSVYEDQRLLMKTLLPEKKSVLRNFFILNFYIYPLYFLFCLVVIVFALNNSLNIISAVVKHWK